MATTRHSDQSVGAMRNRRLRRLLATALLAVLAIGAGDWFAQRQPPVGQQFEPAPPENGLIDWLKRPMEVNRHARVVGESFGRRISSVFFDAAGKRGWAVGDGILATTDGGASWSLQNDGAQSWLNSVTFARDGQHGWAVGNHGVVLATGDGGAHWQESRTDNAREWLTSVTFPGDDQHGWAVRSDGGILATRDGGASWTVTNKTAGSQCAHPADGMPGLASLAFNADGQHGWAVGDGGTVLVTTDGGACWERGVDPSGANLAGVSFAANARDGWAVGSLGTMLVTHDGGRSWTAPAADAIQWTAPDAPGAAAPDLVAVSLSADGQRGWAVGSHGAILVTADGGASWARKPSQSDAAFASVSMAGDGKHGWVASEDSLLATDDGGDTWTPQLSNARGWFAGVSFAADGQRGWAVGNHGMLLATTDGGASWTPQASHIRSWLYGVTFAADALHGWAVGDDGSILRTLDGGASWLRWNDELHVATVDHGKAWREESAKPRCVEIPLDDGQAPADGGACKPANAGRSHAAPGAPEARVSLTGVRFAADGRRGWAVGYKGTILATSDGGRSWTLQPSGTEEWLHGLTFAPDARHGWAVGNGGSILGTSDGGASWTAQPIFWPRPAGPKAAPGRADARSDPDPAPRLYGITFANDARHGWAVGSGGSIFATDDGGASWTPQTSGTEHWLTSVSFADDARHGWAVGYLGTILATDDGGALWTRQTSNSDADLMNVSFASDARHGWASGGGGTLLGTSDGGASWHPIAPYARYPARWFFVLVALCVAGLVAVQAFDHMSSAIRSVILAHAVDDEPINDGRADCLDFAPIVNALASFLRHDATRPPLALAITARWGRGKSSMMRMLRARLGAEGCTTIWFNAWHHQKDGVALAALLGVLQHDATPPLLTPAGLRFRLKLLWLRWRRAPVASTLPALAGLVVLFGAPVVLASSLLLPKESFRFLANLGAALAEGLAGNQASEQMFAGNWAGFFKLSIGMLGSEPSRVLLPLAAVAVGGGSLAYLFLYMLRSFPERPGVLLATAGKDFSTRQANEQTSFRQRFRENFRDVCEALQPGALTVFIDDLDRCTPDACADVLEAVNFLVTSGRCFVVLGIAREIVETQLAKQFGDLGPLIADFDLVRNLNPSQRRATDAKPGPHDVTRKQLEHAQAYLRKLIQIDIPVPLLAHDGAAALLSAASNSAAQRAATRTMFLRGLLGGGQWCLRAAALCWLLWWAQSQGLDWLATRRAEETAHQAAIREQLRVHENVELQRLVTYVEYLRGWGASNPAPPPLPRPEPGVAVAPQKPLSREAVAGLREEHAARIKQAERNLKQMEERLDRLALTSLHGPFALFSERDAEVSALNREVLDWIDADRAYAAHLANYEEALGIAKSKPDTAPAIKPEAGPGNKDADSLTLPVHLLAGVDAGAAPDDATQSHPAADDRRPRELPAFTARRAADLYPRVLPIALVLLIVAVQAWRIGRQSPRVRARERYVEALHVWQTLLLTDRQLRSPRETKRLMNLSRYATVRLNPALYHRETATEALVRLLSRADAGRDAPPAVGETIVVALTALYLSRPGWLEDKDLRVYLQRPLAFLCDRLGAFTADAAGPDDGAAAPAATSELVQALRRQIDAITRAMDEARALGEAGWSEDDVKRFIDAVSEFGIGDAPRATPARAAHEELADQPTIGLAG